MSRNLRPNRLLRLPSSNSPLPGPGIATKASYYYPANSTVFHVLEVVEVNSLHQLAGYRLAWAKLLAVTRAASFFQSLDWLEVYWRHFGGGQALRALVIKSDRREVLGILPFAVCRQRSLVGSLRALGYPFDSWGTFHGPIGPDPMLTLAAGLSYIAHTPRDWDLLDLRGIDLDHTDHGRTALAFEYAELPARRFACGRSAFIELDQGWDTYWHGRLCDFRTRVSTAEQELAEHGRVKYVRHRPLGRAHGDDDPRWDLYDACERIAPHDNSAECCYFRDLHAAAARAGGLDLNLLYFNGRPAAFSYNVHYRGIVNILRMGFDGSIADRDVLTVLIANMIRDGCQRGDTRIDFGPRSSEHAGHWTTRIATAYRYTHCPVFAVRAQMLLSQQWLKRGLFARQPV